MIEPVSTRRLCLRSERRLVRDERCEIALQSHLSAGDPTPDLSSNVVYENT